MMRTNIKDVMTDLGSIASRLEADVKYLRRLIEPQTTPETVSTARTHVLEHIDQVIARWVECCTNNPPPTTGWEYDQAVLSEWRRVRDLIAGDRP